MFVVDDGHIDIVVLLGPFPSHVRECFRVHVVWWTVAEISREVDAGCNTGVDVDKRLQVLFLTFIACNAYTALSFLVFLLLHLVLIVGVIAKQHSFCERSHAFDAGTSEANGEIGSVRLLSSSDNGSTSLSVSVDISIVFFSETDEHCFSTFTPNEGHGGLWLALEIAVSEDTVDLCFQCNVHACCMGFWYDICSFKQRENERSIDVVT